MSTIQANTTYAMINVKGGTCMDLSGGVSVTGYDYHNGPNQQWTFERADADDDRTFYVRSRSGPYLAPADGAVHDGQQLVGAAAPYAWRVEDQPGIEGGGGGGGVRLCPAGEPGYCADLSDHGNPALGTAVKLWGRWAGENQVWRARAV